MVDLIISKADDQHIELIEKMSLPQIPAHSGDGEADPAVQPMLAERVGFLLAKLHQRWAVESIAVLRDTGVGLSGMHFGALSVIDGLGPMSQQALGEYIGKDRTTIVAIVDELEEEGLVERRRNPDDRRAYALQVTPRGHDWLTRAKPALVTAEDGLLDALDAEERATLMSLLQRVLFGPDARR